MSKVKAMFKSLPGLKISYHLINRWKANIRNKIYNKPSSIKRSYILKMANKYNIDTYFIETGTFLGDTVAFMIPHFSNIISIELSEDLALKSQKRFENEKNVQIINGDSSKELINIMNELNTPAVFWLDGHYSSEFFIGNDYIITAKGDEVTPIMNEIEIILSHTLKNHLILIDDYRLFTGKGDYPSLKTVKHKIAKYNYEIVEIKNDIIVIASKYN